MLDISLKACVDELCSWNVDRSPIVCTVVDSALEVVGITISVLSETALLIVVLRALSVPDTVPFDVGL